jgi:hypothetical protein
VYEKERERGISKVKVEEKEGEWFETTKAVRQGCSLSLLLFTIYREKVELGRKENRASKRVTHSMKKPRIRHTSER